jgi:hypothetical protein
VSILLSVIHADWHKLAFVLSVIMLTVVMLKVALPNNHGAKASQMEKLLFKIIK